MTNKTVFKGRLINLVVKKVRLPNGYTATLETIKHPGAALIVPFPAKKFTYLGRIFPVPGYSTECISIYKAEGLTKEEHEAEKDEVIEARVFTRAGIRKLFNAGKIVDAKTIAAFAMCGWL